MSERGPRRKEARKGRKGRKKMGGEGEMDLREDGEWRKEWRERRKNGE